MCKYVKISINDELSIIRRIGGGQFSDVYHAISGKKDVVIKHYHKKQLDERIVKLIQGELQIHSTLDHPNIVKVLDTAESASGDVYIMLEYLYKGDLYEYMRKYSIRFSEATLKESVVFPLVKTISYLHENNIIHRDIKLENLLIKDERFECVLSDFGFAIDFKKEKPSFRLGTPMYIAPEVDNCKTSYGPKIDCWSVGILAYECIYGKAPIIGIDGVLFKNETITADMKDFLTRCLQVNPDNRASSKELENHPWFLLKE